MKIPGWILGFGMAIVGTCALGANLGDAPIVFRSGEWSVLRTLDQMTDQTNCTGIYKKDYAVQLTDDELFVKVRGGVKGVTLRFGDQPAEKLRLATKSERSLSSVSIEGGDFTKLLGSTRLRMQVLTVLDTVAEVDIDLTGVPAAVENIRSGCSGPPIEAKSVEPTACGDRVVARLRQRGVSQDIITFACAIK
jgi:hypothetical protein